MNEKIKEIVETKGYVSFEEFKEITTKTVGKAYNMESLKLDGLRVTRFEGQKVLADLNKTKTALKIIYSHGKSGVHMSTIFEVNQWDSHVTGSVFRQSARDKYNIEKSGKTLIAK